MSGQVYWAMSRQQPALVDACFVYGRRAVEQVLKSHDAHLLLRLSLVATLDNLIDGEAVSALSRRPCWNGSPIQGRGESIKGQAPTNGSPAFARAVFLRRVDRKHANVFAM
jgi:hypothetical protein